MYDFQWAEQLDDIVWGQLTDGTYFYGQNFDNYNHTVWFVDEDPWIFLESDDNDGVEDWLEYHVIDELSEPENYNFWDNLMQFMADNRI